MMEKLTLWQKFEILFALVFTHFSKHFLVKVCPSITNFFWKNEKKLEIFDNFCTRVKLANNNRHKVSEDVDQI